MAYLKYLKIRQASEKWQRPCGKEMYPLSPDTIPSRSSPRPWAVPCLQERAGGGAACYQGLEISPHQAWTVDQVSLGHPALAL